jgi:hypothetical protein
MVLEVSADGGRDYRLAFQRWLEPGAATYTGRPRGAVALEDDEGGSQAGWMATMCLWCLNPSVAFGQLAGTAHSIILTSGTLSPLDGFASELGSPFNIRLEGPHVVDMRRQVWAGVVGVGPRGHPLQGVYRHARTPEYQDEVGAAVGAACTTIPDGVLLFLPSYSTLDGLCTRWQETGQWAALGRLKGELVCEPRGGGAEALKAAMDTFYGAIAAGKGALFIAVCRGKVSEGLDFADANARGVLVVGIPFPNVRDVKVDHKRRFNNAHQRTLGLLNGDQWYEQQAFRALNQAVGRCIRHRLDWGAIVLVDSRFGEAKYQRGLSRWVRGALVQHGSFGEAQASMQAFFHRLAADPPGDGKPVLAVGEQQGLHHQQEQQQVPVPQQAYQPQPNEPLMLQQMWQRHHEHQPPPPPQQQQPLPLASPAGNQDPPPQQQASPVIAHEQQVLPSPLIPQPPPPASASVFPGIPNAELDNWALRDAAMFENFVRETGSECMGGAGLVSSFLLHVELY